MRLISKRLKEVAAEEANALADQITSTDDCRKMFRAAKQLRSLKPTPPIIVHDTDGNLMGTDEGKARAIKDWFQQQFTDQQDEPLQPFEGTPRPLQNPITEEEVKTAIAALQNGRAARPDGINSELFKHSKHIVSCPLAKIINSSFEHHKTIQTLEGTLSQPPADSPAEQHQKDPVHHYSAPHQRQNRPLHWTLPKWFQKRQELRRHCMGTAYADLSSDDKEMGLPQNGH